jgi:hypothetical protein
MSEMTTEKAIESLRERFPADERFTSQMSLVKAYCLLEIVSERNKRAMQSSKSVQ